MEIEVTVNRVGSGSITRKVFFEAVSDHELTDEEISSLQKKNSYDPLGYGEPFHIFRKKLIDGRYWTCWKCWGSCD